MEISPRALHLTQLWETRFGQLNPGWPFRGLDSDRWVRFHSLPGSKRYADTDDEHQEVLRRHRTVLNELLAHQPVETLIVIGTDWDHRDLMSGKTKQSMPGAWPWRQLPEDEYWERVRYIWVTSGLASEVLDRLLASVADDRAKAIISDAELSWIYAPYDSGADVWLETRFERDLLRDRHEDWLSSRQDGL
ncbi:hypothetical protein [uncultured Jatrophihabitans sp.]|uniref:DUF3885 domain-containing protein n=1 Tax=uncultured Jatrophihabitans sp. TaxID=1610747 RepID=UPI0035CB64AD